MHLFSICAQYFRVLKEWMFPFPYRSMVLVNTFAFSQIDWLNLPKVQMLRFVGPLPLLSDTCARGMSSIPLKAMKDICILRFLWRDLLVRSANCEQRDHLAEAYASGCSVELFCSTDSVTLPSCCRRQRFAVIRVLFADLLLMWLHSREYFIEYAQTKGIEVGFKERYWVQPMIWHLLRVCVLLA